MLVSKNNLLLIFIPVFSLLLMSVTLITVHAGCEDGYYNASPGGINPTSDTSLPSNCESPNWINNQRAVNLRNGRCSPVERVTYSYCRQGTASIATASGRVIIYSPPGAYELRFRNVDTGASFTIRRGNLASPINTDINIQAGQRFVFTLGGRDFEDGTGWRQLDSNVPNTFRTNAIAHAAANGNTIISEQYWADDFTCRNSSEPSEGCSLYDSYDFDDQMVIIAVVNPAPSCSTSNVSLNVVPVRNILYLGENATFSITTNNRSIYRFVNNTYEVTGMNAPAFRIVNPNNGVVCNPEIPNGLNSYSAVCKIQNRVWFNTSFQSPVKWIHNYQVCNGTACNSCSVERTFTVNPYPGFMRTDKGGTSFVGRSINQLAFPSIVNNQFFTRDLFLTRSGNINTFTPNTLLNLSSISKATNYNDINNSTDDWFTWYKSSIFNKKELNLIDGLGNTIINQSLLDGYDNSYRNSPLIVDVANITGDATITDTSGRVYCKRPTIFLVQGTLNIDTQFLIPNNTDTACMFIVGGTVNVRTRNNFDEIHSFIITGNYNSMIRGTSILKGGLVLQGNSQNLTLSKNVNAEVVDANNINPTTPSEYITYDGARYIKFFGKYLKNPFQVSIREIQYTK